MATSSFAGTTPKLAKGAAPGPLGNGPAGSGLTASDQLLLEQLGTHMDGTPWSLTELMLARDRHVGAYTEAVRAVGAQSGAAQLNRAAVARLDELIQERRSPHGVAKENLGKVLHRAKHEPRAVSDKHLNAAVRDVVTTAKKAYADGSPHHGDEQATRLLIESARVWCQRRKAELEKIISKARHPGSEVTEGQVTTAIAAVFAAERHRARLKDDEQLPGAGTFAFVGEALRIIHARRRAALQDLIERAKQPGSTVTDQQLHDGVCGALASARAEALAGIEDVDASGPGTLTLMLKAQEVAEYRHKVELQRLLTEGRRPDSPVTPQQVSTVVKKLLGDKRGRALLGDSADPPGRSEIWKLMEEASEVFDKLRKAPAKPPVRHTHPQKEHRLYIAPLR
jgi:hypothetical protein